MHFIIQKYIKQGLGKSSKHSINFLLSTFGQEKYSIGMCDLCVTVPRWMSANQYEIICRLLMLHKMNILLALAF